MFRSTYGSYWSKFMFTISLMHDKLEIDGLKSDLSQNHQKSQFYTFGAIICQA